MKSRYIGKKKKLGITWYWERLKIESLEQSEKQRYSHRLQLRQRNGISGGIDRKEQKNTRMGSLRAIMEL